MQNLTAEELLASISHRSRQTNLGTLIDAEMYTNTITNTNTTEVYKKENTFQQSSQPTALSVNVEEASPLPFASQGASHPGVREDREKNRLYGREAKVNDFFTEIQISLGKPKEGTRTTRCSVYFSLKTDTDKKYNIFLRSKLTTSIDETMRSILKNNNLPLRDILNEFIESGANNLMVGRIQYKPVNNFITKQHRSNHKNGLAAVYMLDGIEYCTLYFNGEYYQFELTDDMTQSQCKSYSKIGLWSRDNDEEIA